MLVTSFPTHTQRKKLKFSETELSFAVKVKLRQLSVFSFVKLWCELRTRRAFDRGELVPRVHWLFGQRVVASRDSGIMEKIYFFDWLIIKQTNGEPEPWITKPEACDQLRHERGI